MQKRSTLGPIVILAMFAFINPFNHFSWIETDGLCVDCLERGSWQAVTSGFELSAGAKFKFKIALKFPISTANRAAEVKMIHVRRIFGTFDWALAWFDSKFYHRISDHCMFCVHIIGKKFNPPRIFGLLRSWYFVKKCWTVVKMWPIQSRQIVEE